MFYIYLFKGLLENSSADSVVKFENLSEVASYSTHSHYYYYFMYILGFIILFYLIRIFLVIKLKLSLEHIIM